MATLDQVIGAYRALKERKEALAKEQKEAMAPILEQMRQCQLWVHQQLLAQGAQNCRTELGSAFLQEDFSATVSDWPALLEWIKANNLWEFLEQRVSKTVVTEYAEHTKTLPPGVNLKSEISCHIRK
jgi:hypothetical protein